MGMLKRKRAIKKLRVPECWLKTKSVAKIAALGLKCIFPMYLIP